MTAPVVTLDQFNALKAQFDSIIGEVKTLKRKLSSLESVTEALDSDYNVMNVILEKHDERLKKLKTSAKLNIPKVLEEPPVVLEEPPRVLEEPPKIYEASEPLPQIYEAPEDFLSTPPYSPIYSP